jgi:hypothetical protein
LLTATVAFLFRKKQAGGRGKAERGRRSAARKGSAGR